MQPRKQQGILHFLARNDFSFQKRTTLFSEKNNQDERKTEKENLSGNTLKMLGTWLYCSSM